MCDGLFVVADDAEFADDGLVLGAVPTVERRGILDGEDADGPVLDVVFFRVKEEDSDGAVEVNADKLAERLVRLHFDHLAALRVQRSRQFRDGLDGAVDALEPDGDERVAAPEGKLHRRRVGRINERRRPNHDRRQQTHPHATHRHGRTPFSERVGSANERDKHNEAGRRLLRSGFYARSRAASSKNTPVRLA